MAAMIEVDGLCKRFGAIQAVDDVSFKVERGEVLGFLGPNGAGKSTAMRIITGFLEPDSGTVRLEGVDIRDRPIAARQNLGYMPEGAPSYHEMTPLGFLGFIAGIRGFSGSEAEDRIATAAQQTQLGSVLYQSIDTLSRGFKRRVGLAQALLHDPEILVLDEPTDGLDPNQKHEVRTLIQEMAANKAIIISTHILEEVDAVCSRAIIISHGRIVADGTPEELKSRSERHMGVAITATRETCRQLVADLNALNGVRQVELEPRGLFVKPVRGSDILDPVRVLVRQRGLSVADIRLEMGRLEDVFREVTIPGGTGPGGTGDRP